MKEKKFSHILKEKRIDLGYSQEEMSLAMGISQRMYSYYEGGTYDDSSSFRIKRYLLKLAELKKPERMMETKVNGAAPKGNIIHVPHYAYGGFLRGYSNKVYVDNLQHYSLPGITGTHYSFEISGMSMYNRDDARSAGPGDWVIGREEEALTSMAKNKGYILQTIDGIIYKVFDKLDDSKAHFASLNPDYPKEIISLKSIKKIYFVIKILKDPYT